MPLTRDFKETVKARAEADSEFREALLTKAVDLFLEGDIDTGRVLMRDYINATVGFEKLASDTGKPSKSLMRMFSAGGNPRTDNFFAVLKYLQDNTGVRVSVARKS